MNRVFLLLCAATLYLSLSGFECASTEMSTAKLAMQRRDYAKAEEALKKEVAARPQNGDAWSLLGDLYAQQSRFGEMTKAYSQAEAATQPAIKPEAKKSFSVNRYNGWLRKYNLALKQNSAKEYRQALAELDTAGMLRPGYPDNTFVKSMVYLSMEDESSANRSYREYIDMVRTDVEEGMKLGLTIGQTLKQVEDRLGQPAASSPAKEMDTTGSGFASYPQKNNLYVYYLVQKSGDAPAVDGWKFYGDDKDTPAEIREVPVTIRSVAYRNLGVFAYKAGATDKSRYDEALKYFNLLEKLDPSFKNQTGPLISDIYIKSGKIAEARAALDKQIADQPKDANAYMSYGNLLFNSKDFPGAAEKYRKALDNAGDDKETRELALFNLGATFKNIGAAKQDSIKAVLEKTRKPVSKEQNEAFFAPLRESLSAFEKLRSSKAPEIDMDLMKELGNLYDVLGEKAKLKQLATDLEGVDASVKDKEYWRTMSYLYSHIGDVKKAEDADKRSQ